MAGLGQEIFNDQACHIELGSAGGRGAAVLLLPLHPASLTHKNPQGHKIIHGMHTVGCKDELIDLNMRFYI